MRSPSRLPSYSLALALALSGFGIVACTAGGSGDECGDDCSSNDAAGGSEPAYGEPLDGPLIGREDQETPAPGGPAGATAAVGSGSGGGSDEGTGGAASGGAQTDCKTCCEGPHETGDDTFFMRVDDSNSFASPLLTRALLPRWDGQRPLPVRANEYLNFYAPRVEPVGDDTFATNDGAMPVAVGAMNRVFALQVAVRHVSEVDRGGRSIAIVIDTSPSAAEAVDELLGSIDAVFGQVAPSDVVGVYTWATDPEARVIRAFASVQDPTGELELVRSRVVAELARRDEGASLAEPLRAALAETRTTLTGSRRDGTVVLVSDGTSGVDPETIAYAQTESDATSPIRVVGVGVGDPLYYSDEVLDLLTDATGGAYLYFDGGPEARELLETRFRELSETAADDVRLRVELPDSVAPVTTDGGDIEAGSSAAVRGQNLGWGGTMTFYEKLTWSGEVGTECDTLTWTVVSGRDDGAVELGSGSITVGDAFAGLHQSGSMLQAAAVVAAADALRGPNLARLQQAFAAMQAVRAHDPDLWQSSYLPALCETLASACATKKLDCGSCNFGASGEEQP